MPLKYSLFWVRETLFDALLCNDQDLEAYAGTYSGMAKLLRLMHIANRCRSLRIDALRLALAHVQSTHNVVMYQSIHKQLVEAINSYVLFFCFVSESYKVVATQSVYFTYQPMYPVFCLVLCVQLFTLFSGHIKPYLNFIFLDVCVLLLDLRSV